MIVYHRFRLTTWIAIADFFAALALFAFTLYGVQRQKIIKVEEPVRLFVSELSRQLPTRGMKNFTFDEVKCSLTLDEAVLFDPGKWEIKHPEVVSNLAESLKASAEALKKSQKFSLNLTRSFQLVIRGHADAIPIRGGSNTWLSQQRARTLEDALGKEDITAPDFQVSSQGVGEWEPVVDNCSPKSQTEIRSVCPNGQFGSNSQLAPNRRIELRFGYFSGSSKSLPPVRQAATKPPG